MIRPLSSEFSILLSDVKSQLAGRTKTSYGPRVIFSEAYQFQSTAPVWGPTPESWQLRCSQTHFNPRPPCGGRRMIWAWSAKPSIFQSTAPVWGPTMPYITYSFATAISIHGPRVGADLIGRLSQALNGHFNPRPPCGGRQRHLSRSFTPPPFQSTAPVWGPTSLAIMFVGTFLNFNPRPPCGGRRGAGAKLGVFPLFQSTAPVWGPTLLHRPWRR